MSIDLYHQSVCAGCRAVMLTANAIELELNLKELDLSNGENQTPEYEQMNPQKTIPFLVDDDYKLSESRAIMCYLVDQYSDNSDLYPSSPMKRAVVQQRLYFDAGTLQKCVAAYYYPVVFKGASEYVEADYEKMKAAFATFDSILENKEWAAGDTMTLADYSLIATVTTAEAFGFDLEEYKNVFEWSERVKSTAPGYDTANGEGVETLKKFITDTGSE